MVFKGFSIFSCGGHFVQQNRTILAILVKNISVKLFCNQVGGPWPRRRCCLKIFYFALNAILFSGTAPF